MRTRDFVYFIVMLFIDYRKQSKSKDEILTEINKITKNQAKIIESLDTRRRKHIDWLIHHVGGILHSLIECYQKLVSRITTTRSEIDLNIIQYYDLIISQKFFSIEKSCKIFRKLITKYS